MMKETVQWDPFIPPKIKTNLREMDTNDIYIFDFVYTVPLVSNGVFWRHFALLNIPIYAFGGT